MVPPPPPNERPLEFHARAALAPVVNVPAPIVANSSTPETKLSNWVVLLLQSIIDVDPAEMPIIRQIAGLACMTKLTAIEPCVLSRMLSAVEVNRIASA